MGLTTLPPRWVIIICACLVVTACAAVPATQRTKRSAHRQASATSQPTTQVLRVGLPLALVIPQATADTADLAQSMTLDPDEADRWLTQSPNALRVPNTVLIELGAATAWTTAYGLGPPREAVAARFLQMARHYEHTKRAMGYHVIFRIGVTPEQSHAALDQLTANRTLAAYAFFGHGDHGILNTTLDPNRGLPPDRYVRYGLAEMKLHACGSLTPSGAAVLFKHPDGRLDRHPPDSTSLWRYNVAPNGKLTGYLQADITALNAAEVTQVPGLRYASLADLRRRLHHPQQSHPRH